MGFTASRGARGESIAKRGVGRKGLVRKRKWAAAHTDYYPNIGERIKGAGGDFGGGFFAKLGENGGKKNGEGWLGAENAVFSGKMAKGRFLGGVLLTVCRLGPP